MERFQNFLNREFKKKELSQNKLAETLGISSFYLGQLLKGEKAPPDRELQIKISECLELEEDKRKKYFDLIAKEKNDIPTDIYKDIYDNQDKWNEIRELIERKIK